MAWAIRTIYTSKCVQMGPQQLPKTSKFYSICNKCDMQKTVGGGYTPFGRLKVKLVLLGYTDYFLLRSIWAIDTVQFLNQTTILK